NRLKLARPVPLEQIRSLISLLHRYGPLTYTQMQRAAQDESTLTTRAGTFPKKSTYYHVYKAAVLQGLIRQDKGVYKLSPIGESLGKVSTNSIPISKRE